MKRDLQYAFLITSNSRGHRRCHTSLCHIYIRRSLLWQRDLQYAFLDQARGLEGTDAFASFNMTSCFMSLCHIYIYLRLFYDKETYNMLFSRAHTHLIQSTWPPILCLSVIYISTSLLWQRDLQYAFLEGTDAFASFDMTSDLVSLCHLYI